MKKINILFISVAFTLFQQIYCHSQKADLSYFFNQKAKNLNPSIPSPAQFLGSNPGQWHVRHDQLVAYLSLLAEKSSRIKIEDYGRTFENRRLLLLIISSPENIDQLDTLHKNHSDWIEGKKTSLDDVPLVTWLGYSVHGDEPSGSNAALLIAYYLAASNDETVLKWLKEGIILIDPSINPDGLDRFANWVNSNKSFSHEGDPNHRPHHQLWPSGRTNHYWFDLNRDWLPAQLPESQGRLKKFHYWQPNVLTDHHEMGHNRTFFFQPGVPTRKNPLTPDENVLLTQTLATYHAEALDAVGSLYYTKETFDDFYYGKGSTYPDLHGAVGILFEQASSEGHKIRNPYGILTFPFAIRNHLIASLSTLKGSFEHKDEFLNYQQKFYREALEKSHEEKKSGFVFGDEYNKTINYKFLKLLQRHQIKVYNLSKNLSLEGHIFKKDEAYFVPFNQKQYKMIKTIFETQVSFQDSIFYDISTWTFPLAFNIPYAKIDKKLDVKGKEIENINSPKGQLYASENAIGFAFEWHSYYSPKALYQLLKAGIKATVAKKRGVFQTIEGLKVFDYGSIFIPLGIQKENKRASVKTLLKKIAFENGINIYGIDKGLANEGIDIGSPNFEILQKPHVLLIAGDGINPYEAGEVWHLLDQRFDIPVTIVRQERLEKVNLSYYNTLILVDGNYNFSSAVVNNIKSWLRSGKRTIIATKFANNWLVAQKLLDVEIQTFVPTKTLNFIYNNLSRDLGAKRLGGSIFQTYIDITHPLGWGYKKSLLPVFKNHLNIFNFYKDSYSVPLNYIAKPLLSGYVPDGFIKQLSLKPSIIVSSYGSGRIISFSDNPNFRAFWYGTNKTFLNALFFGSLIATNTN